MCGLAGALDFAGGNAKAELSQKLSFVSKGLTHRGPDSNGTWSDEHCGLAHTRLSIIDLSERATQPMLSPDGRFVVTFNGEIYNFKDIRAELEALGHSFRSDSDTEILLQGFRQYGEELPKHLRGMFAFAIWDRKERTLFAARDRFGKKPFYYVWVGKILVFASEIRALLAWPEIEREVDLNTIHDYLTFGNSVGQRTAFRNIRNLPPAHYWIVKLDKQQSSQPVRYWAPAEVDPTMGRYNSAALCEEFLCRFDEALKLRLVADVPVGAFLSGGVDSSTVVARAAGMVDRPLKTFSVGFARQGYDESEFAQQVADEFATDHHAFVMDETLIETLPELIWNYAEPFSDSSALVATALSHQVSKHVTVALTGDGGDEIFLGYQRYQQFQKNLSGGAIPESVQISPFSVPELSVPLNRDYYMRSIATFRDLHKMWGYGPALMDQMLVSSSDRMPLVLEDINPELAIDAAARADVATYLPDDLLVKTDIATMSASLEARSPFLDHELADWATSLPQASRVITRNGFPELKGLLKLAMEPQLSADLLYREKQGFRVPVRHWLRNEVRELTMDILDSKTFHDRGLFRPEFIRWMLKAHHEGIEDHGTRIWNLLCLELWYQTFIDRPPSGPLGLTLDGGRMGFSEKFAA